VCEGKDFLTLLIAMGLLSALPENLLHTIEHGKVKA
jgi:hypothetical protein